MIARRSSTAREWYICVVMLTDILDYKTDVDIAIRYCMFNVIFSIVSIISWTSYEWMEWDCKIKTSTCHK